MTIWITKEKEEWIDLGKDLGEKRTISRIRQGLTGRNIEERSDQGTCDVMDLKRRARMNHLKCVASYKCSPSTSLSNNANPLL